LDTVARQTELLKGTLDLLILRSLELESRHGLGIAERIAQVTQGTFVVKPGSLFPALHRLEQRGFIEGEWISSPAGRRARSYQLTAAGRRQLASEKKEWSRIAMAVGRMLDEPEG
jgi:PadR family transcriptional regulator, regulatory protein PadR